MPQNSKLGILRKSKTERHSLLGRNFKGRSKLIAKVSKQRKRLGEGPGAQKREKRIFEEIRKIKKIMKQEKKQRVRTVKSIPNKLILP